MFLPIGVASGENVACHLQPPGTKRRDRRECVDGEQTPRVASGPWCQAGPEVTQLEVRISHVPAGIARKVVGGHCWTIAVAPYYLDS
jgi:hypothetical protein